MSFKPIFFSSASTFEETAARNKSRLLLMASISMVATTKRNCPKIMSLARLLMASCDKPKSRSAALFIMLGSVEIPTVKRDGTSTLMFCLLKALLRLISIEIGVKSRKAYEWMIGHINAAPPWIHFAERDSRSAPLPILP
jgi:hypothetical protein